MQHNQKHARFTAEWLKFLRSIKRGKQTFPGGTYIQELLLYTEEKLSWSKAQSFCRRRHDDLATIYNWEENNDISNLAADVVSPFWIGLYHDADSWRWSLPEERFYDGATRQFRQWQETQPDNEGPAEHCVSMMNDGFWWDHDCTAVQMPLLCFHGELQEAGDGNGSAALTCVLCTPKSQHGSCHIFASGVLRQRGAKTLGVEGNKKIKKKND